MELTVLPLDMSNFPLATAILCLQCFLQVQTLGSPHSLREKRSELPYVMTQKENEHCFFHRLKPGVYFHCSKGYYAIQTGNSTLECESCPYNTYQPMENYCEKCVLCTDCEAKRMKVLLNCTSTSDTMCVSYIEYAAMQAGAPSKDYHSRKDGQTIEEMEKQLEFQSTVESYYPSLVLVVSISAPTGIAMVVIVIGVVLKCRPRLDRKMISQRPHRAIFIPKGPGLNLPRSFGDAENVIITRTTSTEHERRGDCDVSDRTSKVISDRRKFLSLDFSQSVTSGMMKEEDGTEVDEAVVYRAEGAKCLETSLSISKEGGLIEIPETGVQLQIQPNSFKEDEIHLITLKILPWRIFHEPASCFEDHSTVMVEILPNNLKLKRPARLTLPHCLILKEPKRCDVQIFHSHHEHDQLPNWENITKSVKHELSAHICKIWIENFSWIKYEIGEKEVEGKKLFLYTLGKKFAKGANFVTAEVGYFPALPGNERLSHDEADFITSVKGTCYESKLKKMFQGDWQPFIFCKEPRKPLAISVFEINPTDGWRASPSSSESKEIPYHHVELSNEQGRPFTFQRLQPEAPYPVIHFKISQGEDFSEIYVDMEEGMVKEEPEAASSDQQTKQVGSKLQSSVLTDEQCSSMIGATEMTVDNTRSVLRKEAIQSKETLLVVSSRNVDAICNQQGKKLTSERHFSSYDVHNHYNLQSWEPSLCQLPQPGAQRCDGQSSLPIFSELTYHDVSLLAKRLNPENPLGKDWKMFAEKLGFSFEDIIEFEGKRNPTVDVIHCACQSGKLRTREQLIKILEDMDRLDAIICISH